MSLLKLVGESDEKQSVYIVFIKYLLQREKEQTYNEETVDINFDYQ